LGPHSPKSSPLGAGEADSQRNQAGLDTNLRQFMKNARERGLFDRIGFPDAANSAGRRSTKTCRSARSIWVS
jgi:hypothetical protein